MSDTLHTVAPIAVMALVTMVLRFLPFWLFPAGKKTPAFILYLGRVLPCAVMGMLAVYCYKNITPLGADRRGHCGWTASLETEYPSEHCDRHRQLHAAAAICLLTKRKHQLKRVGVFLYHSPAR